MANTNNKKRSLTDSNADLAASSTIEPSEPQIKRRKLNTSNDEDTKQESPKETTLTIKMSNDELLSFLSDEKDEDLSNIIYLVLYSNDDKDYKSVFREYLRADKFEKIFPNLQTIECCSNFLFTSNLYKQIHHSKLQQITITDCLYGIDINDIINNIHRYPAIQSIHAYHYYYHYKIDRKKVLRIHRKLKNIQLISHLPTCAIGKNIKLNTINTKWKINMMHTPLFSKALNDVVIDPRQFVEEYCLKDFRKSFCEQGDCKNYQDEDYHIFDCKWCSIWKEKKEALDPQKIIIKGGVKYWKKPDEYGENDSFERNEMYLLQFPIEKVDEIQYFDGYMFWNGFPINPDPSHSFEDSLLYKQDGSKWKKGTIYYLTPKECTLLIYTK